MQRISVVGRARPVPMESAFAGSSCLPVLGGRRANGSIDLPDAPPAASMTISGSAGVAADLPSAQVLLALAPVLMVVLGVVVFALVDLVRRPAVAHLPKVLWAIIIVLVAVPFGAIVYLIAGRGPSGTRSAAGAPEASSNTAQSERPLPTAGSADGTSTRSIPAPPAEPASSWAVRTTDLTRDYGGKGLFGVGLRVPRGSVYGLVGPNGSGKTTLLSILDGTRRADRGQVRMTVPRNRIAVCPDVPEFDGWLTAIEVVTLAASLAGVDRSAGAAAEALTAAGLGADLDQRVDGLSRGMIQRLGLACALVGDPELLILDEPTSALDPAGRAEILDLVSNMRGRRTVIFSSHILADVQRVADQVGVLRHGRLLYQGGTRELIDQRLQPRWLVRVASGAQDLRERLAGEPWVTTAVLAGPDAVRVDASSIEDGERGIPAVIAARSQRMVSCEPVAADLEAAFLALTS